MLESDYKSLKSDPMVFVRRQEKPFKISIVAGWVDDLLCIGDKDFLEIAVNKMKEKNFDVTRNEDARAYTGIQFDRIRSRRYMKIHQSEYAKQIIFENDLTHCKPVKSPIINIGIEKEVEDLENRKNHNAEESDRRKFQKACGALMWLVKTRPDIAFALNVLCRNMHNPNKLDFDRLKRIHQYIAHTVDVGMIWEVKGDFESFENSTTCDHITAHADSDLAGRIMDSRSTSGYIINFGETGSFIFVTKVQKNISLSTTHAEITCACECAKTIEWIRGIMGELGLNITRPTVMYQDNKAAIDLCKNPVYHFRTRHFRIAQHYLRDLEKRSIIKTIDQRSKNMWADLMNKSQPPVRHVMLRKAIMGT